MRLPDVDRIRSEQSRSLPEFLRLYNENLPAAFTPASEKLLKEFRATHAHFFKGDAPWSLDLHRKRVMDWLRSRPA